MDEVACNPPPDVGRRNESKLHGGTPRQRFEGLLEWRRICLYMRLLSIADRQKIFMKNGALRGLIDGNDSDVVVAMVMMMMVIVHPTKKYVEYVR